MLQQTQQQRSQHQLMTAAFPINKVLTGVRQQRLRQIRGGTGATFRVTTDANGKIKNVLIDATSFGYTVGDVVTISAAQLAAADGSNSAGTMREPIKILLSLLMRQISCKYVTASLILTRALPVYQKTR